MTFPETPGSVPFSGEFGPETGFGLALMATRDRLYEAVRAEASGLAFVLRSNHFDTGTGATTEVATYLLAEDYDSMTIGEPIEKFTISVPVAAIDLQNPGTVLAPRQEFFVIGTPGDIASQVTINRENYEELLQGDAPLITDFRQKLKPKDQGGYEVVPIRSIV